MYSNILDTDSDHYHQEQTIFDLTPFPMWIFDLETFRFLAVNKEAILQYGYSEEEFLNMTIKDIRPKEDIPKLEKAVKKALTRKEVYKESLYRQKKRDGSIMYVQIKSNLIYYHGKKAEIVTAIDLTNRYKREQKIEAQKEYLKAIGVISQMLLKTSNWSQSLHECFKIIGDTINVDRIYFFQNNLRQQTTSQKIEWSRNHIYPQIDNQELQDIPFSQFPLFMEPLKNRQPFEAIVNELPPSSTREILKHQEIWSILVLPIWIKDDFAGFIGFDDCHRERKFTEDEFQLLYSLTSNLGYVIKEQEAYQELSFNEARFKALIQNSKDLLAIIDDKGNYKFIAPASKTVLGVSPDEFLGKNAFDFVYNEDAPRLKQQLDELLKSEYISSEPYRFLDGNGNWRWLKTESSNHLKTPFIEGIVTNTHEVTSEVKKQKVDELRVSLTQAVGQPGTLLSCLDEALNILLNLPEIAVSEIWLVSNDETRLDLFSIVCREGSLSSFCQTSKDVNSLVMGDGLPGLVWKDDKTVVMKDLSSNERFCRPEAAREAGLHTGIGLPLKYNNEFLGCITCFSQYIRHKNSEVVSLLTEVSQQLGAVIKQKITEVEYRSFFNISPDPHCIVGFDGFIKKFNKAFVNLLGYGENEIVTTPIFQLIHKDDQKEAMERLQASIKQASIKGVSPRSFEARFLTRSGHIRWLIWTGTIVPESKIFVAVAKDITEQKLAEQEFRMAYDRLVTAQKIAKLGYWVREVDSEASYWSDETYKIYEYSPREFTPTMENIAKTFHPDDRYLIEINPIKRLEPGKVKSYEHRIITGTGKMKWLHQEIRLVTDDQGNPVRIEGALQDITERKEHEEQLSISNERFNLPCWPVTKLFGKSIIKNKR
ncbi:PAS domain S-box protein [Flexithrix dorotheae]|uniref:PAS domain S-box protein n=1 Tax=Flexithrix dorotheae TaxID=70993 RepID=UPI001B7F84DD|nr:PAS domain S-box protein [Flexithrix dorotheae]